MAGAKKRVTNVAAAAPRGDGTLGIWAGLSIFVVAFALRRIVGGQLSDLPLIRTPQMDAFEFLTWARRIAGGDLRLPVSAPHSPGYPFFLGFLLARSQGSLTFVRTVQAVLGALNAVLIGSLGSRWFGRFAGAAAGFLAAVYGPAVFVESDLYAEGLLLLLLVLALWSAVRIPRAVSWSAAAGLFLGLAVLVRPTALLFAPLFIVKAIGDRVPGRPRWAAPVLLAAVMALLLFPPVARASRLSGGVTLVQGYGGMNFYLGNSPSGTGLPSARPGGGWDWLEGEAARHGLFSPSDQDRYYFRKTLAEIRRQPFAFLRLLARKTFWTFQSDEIRDSHSLAFFKSQSRVLSLLPGFGVLVAFAVPGLALASRPRGAGWFLSGFVAIAAAGCILLVVGMRYRLPLVLGLLLAAGAGAAVVVQNLRARSLRGSCLAVGLAAGAFLLSHLARHADSHNFAEEWAMTASALLDERDVPGADDAAARAVSADPGSAFAWTRRGMVEAARGDREKAREAFRRAEKLDPHCSDEHTGLARLAIQEGSWEAAASEYRQALAILPDNPESQDGLGRALLSAGQPEKSIGIFQRLVATHSEEASAHEGLARSLEALHRPAEGLREAQVAADLSPSDPEMWFLLAMHSLNAGNVALAASAIGRAEALGGDSDRVAFARSVVLRLEGDRGKADEILRSLLEKRPDAQPVIALFLQNASEMGRRREAEQFISSLRSRVP